MPQTPAKEMKILKINKLKLKTTHHPTVDIEGIRLHCST
jgi:hypothetical protein